MEKTCNGCGTEKSAMAMVTMSSADWQRNEQRHERREKRYIGLIVLLIVLLVGSNAAWLAYEIQFETVESIIEEDIVVDADSNGTANYIGNDGNIYNGEDNNQEEDDNQNP
jgi:hypothetical protein